MTGYIIPCFPKRTINLGGGNLSQEIVLADRLELVHWRDVTVMFRVHDHTLAGHNNSITLGVYPQTVSADDPGMLFIDPNGLLSVTVDKNTQVPSLLTLGFPDFDSTPYHAPMIRVVAQSTRADSGTISATFSADISVKDS